MSLNIVTSMPLYSAQAGMTRAQKQIEKVSESIASGVKVNLNPADSYVASGLNTDIRASKAAISNAQTGYNFTSVADGILSNVSDSLGRIKELSVQAANGVYSDNQRAAIQQEINQNVEHIQKTLSNAQFNGKNVLNVVTQDSSDVQPVMDFYTGADSSSVISYDPNLVTQTPEFDVSSPEAAAASAAKVDGIMSDINSKRAEIGAVQTDFEGAINQQMTNVISASSAFSDIQDTDYLNAIVEMKQAAFSVETMAKVMKTVMNADKYVLDMLK